MVSFSKGEVISLTKELVKTIPAPQIAMRKTPNRLHHLYTLEGTEGEKTIWVGYIQWQPSGSSLLEYY